MEHHVTTKQNCTKIGLNIIFYDGTFFEKYNCYNVMCESNIL